MQQNAAIHQNMEPIEPARKGSLIPRMVFEITVALLVLNEEEDVSVSDADDDVVAVDDEEFDKEVNAAVDYDGDRSANTNHTGNITRLGIKN